MGIELPPELADVAAKTGVAWPEADEEAMAQAAQAWRDAANSMSTLATDADTTARAALGAVSGETGDAAAKHWKTFVEPDSGHLTAAVRGCTDAADRLAHASHQVGAAKVEIVRQLVGLAQNSDAANAAAASGHPMALAGLDTAVRGTAANVANIETNLVSAVQPVSGVDVGAVQNPVNPNPGTHGPPPGITTGVTDLVTDTAQGATNVVTGAPDVVAGVPDVVAGVPDVVAGAPDVVVGVPDVVSGVGVPVQPGDIVTPGTDFGPGVPGIEPDPDITGPVPIPPDLVDPGDTPTPPTGQTMKAGFAPGSLDAVPSHANLPPAPPPVASQAPAPGAGFGGTPFTPGGPVAGSPPVAPVPPPAASAQPGAPAVAPPRGPVPGAAAMAVPGTAAPDRPATPEAPRAKPAAMAGPPGAPPARGERDSVLAVFWLHMFPIGHLPVAADRPARQLPPPPAELDYAAGLRFEPGDHPRFDLIDSTARRAELPAAVPTPMTPGLPADDPTVAELAEGHDPLGGDHERDWDRRYLVRFGSVTPQGISAEGVEFNWPPSEQYPEGGSAPGEAEVLDEGVLLDRFGSPAGRVFAAAGTPFAQRSLPPAHLDHGYRRYQTRKPLPVWRAVSAAWFAQPGGGVRYRTTHSAAELVALGYLADVTEETA